MFSLFVGQIKGQRAGHALYEVSSFGEEGEHRFVLFPALLVISSHGSHGHVLLVVSRFLRLVINGHDPAVNLFVLGEEVLHHSLVIEGVGIHVFESPI